MPRRKKTLDAPQYITPTILHGSTPAPAITAVDVDALDASRDDAAPEAPPERLIVHAQRLAPVALEHLAQLKLAKLASHVPALLLLLASELAARQMTWQASGGRSPNVSLKTAREGASESHADLVAAFRRFGGKDSSIAGMIEQVTQGASDADTLQGLYTLASTARARMSLFDGTDVTAATIDLAEKRHADFSKALARSDEGATATPRVQLELEAARALRMRNRVFWALADLDREACDAGRYIFRKSPREKARFTAYTHTAAATKKKPA